MKSLNEALNKHYGLEHGQEKRYQAVLEQFEVLFGAGEALCFCAPGRVNLIGEHTDYNHGFVMPVALDKDTLIIVRPRQDNTICLSNSEASYPPACFEITEHIAKDQENNWTNYARGVAQVVQLKSKKNLRGFDALVSAAPPYGVPRSAGLSSSSSLTVAVLVALNYLNDLQFGITDLVSLASDAEWYVGTRGGIMDQYISLQGQQGHALFLDCRPSADNTYKTKAIALPVGYKILVINSGVKHQNVGGGYNYRVAACRAAVGILKKSYPNITHLRDVQDEAWSDLEKLLPEKMSVETLAEQGIKLSDIPTITADVELEVKAKCRHVHTENERVLKAIDAMQANNMVALGEQLKEAHKSARDDYDISCPEIEILVTYLNAQEGILGARLTGAGWGGCVVALVKEDAVRTVSKQLKEHYYQETKLECDVFVCKAAAGAGLVYAA